MNKKIYKVLMIIIDIVIISSILSNICLANISEKFGGNMDESSPAKPVTVSIISAVLQIVRTVGMVVAVAILMVIACKYMIASAGDRADIKKYAITYVIGAIILFGASGIAELLKSAIDGSFGNGG